MVMKLTEAVTNSIYINEEYINISKDSDSQKSSVDRRKREKIYIQAKVILGWKSEKINVKF